MRVKYTQTEELEIILEMKGIIYEKEVVILELNNKRFDYYLPEYKLFIEFDGAQHHYPVDHFGGYENYIKQVKNDSEKTLWCYENSYQFLRLNHLMSLNTIHNLLDYILNDETIKTLKNLNSKEIIKNDEVREYDKNLPYIEEWSKNNLNKRNLYIGELFNDYNQLLSQVLGKKYKLDDKIEFENYIANYNENMKDMGIIKKNGQYTKYYINENIDKNANSNMNLTQNDILDLFIQDLKEKGLLEYNCLINKILYEYYKYWFELNNFNTDIMKIKQFGQRFNNKIKEYGFVNDDKKQRIRSIKIYQFNNKLLMLNNDLNLNILIQSNEPSRILFNKDNAIKDEDVFSILNEVKTIDELKNYPLPTIQCFIEEFSNQRLDLFNNIDSIEDIYYLSKEELINQLKEG